MLDGSKENGKVHDCKKRSGVLSADIILPSALAEGDISRADGYPFEPDIKGLFADFDTTSNRLGNTVADKNTRLTAVLKDVAGKV